MAISQADILDAVSNMTITEIVDLISAMEEKFGVTAAVAVAAAPVAGAGAAVGAGVATGAAIGGLSTTAAIALGAVAVGAAAVALTNQGTTGTK